MDCVSSRSNRHRYSTTCRDLLYYTINVVILYYIIISIILADSGSGGEGAKCHVAPIFKFAKYTDDGVPCRSAYRLPTTECTGTCGDETGSCCQPDKVSSQQVQLVCDNGSSIEQQVHTRAYLNLN